MASVEQTASPQARAPFRDEARYIETQIRHTSRSLKFIDFAAGAVTLIVGVLAYLLVAAILDHWIVPGGLTVGMRGMLFALLALGTGWFCWRTFAPLLRQISPVYAAHTIEQGSPSLKNSLLNLLLLRDQSRRISDRVFQAIERQAAQRLSQSPTDAVVDRSAVLRAGYVLVAVVCVCALYAVLSPKDVATSAGRVLAPWSSTPAPSRVQILDVTPGDASVARGERVDVSALVLGAGDDDDVVLRYSSVDGRFTGESANMRIGQDESRYELQLPPPADRTGTIGVQQDLLYWIESGDGRSEKYKLKVFERPTIVVQRIRYEFPAYTGMRSVATESSGDIRAVEGTKVTVQALANHPISSAAIDFDANGSSDLRMRVDGDEAVATFTLRLRPDRRTPEHASYVLRFATNEGRQNRDPAKYMIDVTPDYAPEVRVVSPAEPEVNVHVDETLPITVEAHDPDFALSQIELVGRSGDRELALGQLLSSNVTERFLGAHSFTPREYELRPGDVVEYWAQAADNRQPEPNLAMSQRRRLRIIGRSDLEDNQQRQDQQGDEGDQGDQRQQSGDGSESDEGGTPGGSGESGQESDESDSQTGQGGEGESGDSSAGAEPSQSDEEGGGESGQQQEGDSQSGSGGDQRQDSQNGASDGEREQQDEGQSDSTAGGDRSSDASQPGEQSDSGDQQGQETQRPSKVSPDGDDDATAFDRIRRRLEQNVDGDDQGQQDASSTEDEGAQQNAQLPDDEQASGSNQAQDGQDKGGEPNLGDQTAEDDNRQRSNESADQAETQSSASDGSPDVDASSQNRDAEDETGASERQQGGQQDEAQGESNESGEGSESSEGPESSADRSQGDDGAGKENGREQDGLGPESPNRQRDKTPESNDNGEQPENSEPPSASESKTESDSRGGQQGDQSGGGGRGGGQPSEQQGRGASGENEAADEGGGAASEQGDGATGDDAGQGQQSDGQTGQSSGDQPGAGSRSGEDSGDQTGNRSPENPSASDQNGGDSGRPSAGDQAGQQPSDGQPSDRQPDSQSPRNDADDRESGSSGGAQSSPTGGGSAGDGYSSPSSSELEPGDDPNVEFARQQTDLVLNQLDQQLARDEVDPGLLEDLRWNKEELQQFVDRWRNLKSRANQPGDAGGEARREMDDALRSLGLRRDGQQQFQVRGAADRLRDLQAGASGNPPLEYRDSVRAYTRGAAAASSADDQ